MILITGSTGFLGQAVCAALPDAVGIQGRRGNVDLRHHKRLPTLLTIPWSTPPRTVIHLAYPGADGIGTTLTQPADLINAQLRIDLNVIEACAAACVEKLICIGSVCAYPEHVTFPTGEDQLWAGYPERVNAPYGVAKRMQLELLHAYRRQHGLVGIQLILGNLYGPGDRSGHVIPATIRKVREAQRTGATSIRVWGDGSATREFLYVEDAARAIALAATGPYTAPTPLNICSGVEISIRQLVQAVAAALHWEGDILWDPSMPNGQPRRWFDNRNAAAALDWTPQTPFTEGLQRTIDAWVREDRA